MLAKLGTVLLGMFSSSKASDTAMKIVEKVAGVDGVTAKEKLDWVIEYVKNTKHQSTVRRVIALAVVGGLMFYGAIYSFTAIFESFYVFWATSGETLAEVAASQNLAEIRVKPLVSLQNDLLAMVKEQKEPMMIVLGFYFFTQMLTGARK